MRECYGVKFITSATYSGGGWRRVCIVRKPHDLPSAPQRLLTA